VELWDERLSSVAAHEILEEAGTLVRVHTPEEIVGRRRGRPKGSRREVTKEAVKIRLHADVMAALRASGDGWQTRINDALRASLALGRKIVSR
jgi:uncharacterized protein (DUF4415 family)